MSARTTKDQLRDALNDVGVKTPSKMKKAELVKLYREHVLNQQVSSVSPNDSLIGGFSSDEEEPMQLDTSHITRETNVADLTNDEIFFKLKDLGEHVGPILDSTRTIYERKLIRLLGGDEGSGGDQLDRSNAGFSADEEEDEPEKDDAYDYGMIGSTEEDFKGTGLTEKLLDDDGFLKTLSDVHEKIEQNDANLLRSRRTHTVKPCTNVTSSTNGKSFAPPPPKKRNMPLLFSVVALVVLAVIAVLIWINLEPGKQFDAVPVAGERPSTLGDMGQSQQPPVAANEPV